MKKDKKTNPESLGGRLKGYEASYESTIEPEKHIIIRIDGHKFSKYTKGFKKPFDGILSKAMELTTIDLVDEYKAVTGYTQSDEITLILPSLKDVTIDNRKSYKHKIHKRIRDDWEHTFGGRVQKMVSLIAGFTTMRFNKHLADEIEKQTMSEQEHWSNSFRPTPEEDEFRKQMSTYYSKVGNAYFDCRVYGVPDEDEAFNSILWRVRDAEKNSRSMFAQTYCSHKELQKKTGVEQVEYCKDKTGKDWHKVEDRYKYGVLVKKETYMKDGRDGPVQRTRLVSFSDKLTSYSEESVDLIMRAYK